MSGLLILATLGLMALPTLTRRWGQRLQPREWVRLNAVSVVGGAALLEFALVLCALPAISRVPLLGQWVGSSNARHFFPGGELAGWLSLAAAILLPAAAVGGLLGARKRQAIMRAEPWLGTHLPQGDYELVILPTDDLVAIAVPGNPAQVIVSEGIRNALTARQLRAVVRHEAAHLRAGHSRYLLLAAAMERAYWFFPVVKSSLGTLRLALECSADQAATETEGDRGAIRGALLTLSETGGGVSVAAFGAANGLFVRLQALEKPVPAQLPLRFMLHAGLLSLTVVAIGALSVWAYAA